MTTGVNYTDLMYQGLSSPNLPGQYVQRNQQAAAREDITLWDYGSAAVTGLYHGAALTLPETYARVLRRVGTMCGSEDLSNWASDKIAEYTLLRQEDPYWQPDERWMNDYTARSLYEGFNSISNSLGMALPGLALTPLVPGALAATSLGASFFGAAFGGGIMGGIAKYDKFMDDAVKELGTLNPNLAREDIENEQFWNALLSGFAEGGFEFAGDYFGAKMIGLFGKSVAEPASHILSKLFKNAGKSMLTEVPTEMATAYAQDWIRENAGMDHQGRLKAMIEALGPAVVSAGAYGAAGTVGKHFIPSTPTETKTNMDAMAKKFIQDDLKSRWGEDGYKFFQENLMASGALDEKSAYAITQLANKEAKKWAQREGKDVSEWWADKSRQFTGLTEAGWSDMSAIAQAFVTPESSFDAVVGATLDPLVNSLDQELQTALAAQYQVEGDQNLANDFLVWLKNPEAANPDQAIAPAFESMKEALLDNYGALQDFGAVRISPEAQQMFEGLFPEDAKPVERPKFFEVEDEEGLAAAIAQIADNTPEANDKIVAELNKHIKYNLNPFTVESDVKALLLTYDKALAHHLEPMLARQSDAAMDAKAKEQMAENGYSEAGIHSLFGDVVDNVEGTLSLRMRKAQIYQTLMYQNLLNLAETYRAEATPQNALAVMTAREMMAAVHYEMRGVRSEAGRFLRAVQMAGKDNRMDWRRINELMDDHGGMSFVDKLTTALANARDDQHRRQLIESTLKDKTVEMLLEHVTLGMLTNPATQAVNVAGNTLTLLNETWNRFVGSHLNPDQSTGLVKGETAAMLNGFFKALHNIKQTWSQHKEAQGSWKNAAYNIDQMQWPGAGPSILDDGGMMGRKINYVNAHAVLDSVIPGKDGGGVLSMAHAKATDGLSTMVEFYGRGLGLVSKTLLAADMAFKTVAFHMELQALNYRRAKQQAATGGGDFETLYAKYSSKPLKQDQEAALDFGKKVTFQSDLGAIGKGINKIRQEAPLTRLIIPFLKTPINIIKYGAAHTPVMSKLFAETRNELNSSDAATRQLAEARVMSGSMLWAAALGLAAQGFLTGNGPADPEDKRRLEATGWQSNSLKIGDAYIGLDRLDPGAFILNTAASFIEIAHSLEGSDLEKASIAAMGAAVRTVTNRSYLQSVQSILDLVMNIDRPEGQRALRDLVSNVSVPASALMRTTARVIDPVAHETDTIFNQLRANLPGFSLDAPVRRNFLGEAIAAPDAWGPDYLSPFRGSVDNKDPVYAELARLGQQEGIKLPSMPQRVWRDGDKKGRLDAKQYSKYLEYAGTDHRINGKTQKEYLNDLIASGLYQRASDDRRASLIDKATANYRNAAKRKMMRDDPGIRYLLGL